MQEGRQRGDGDAGKNTLDTDSDKKTVVLPKIITKKHVVWERICILCNTVK